MRSIDEGLFGTAMPGWKSRLSDRQRRDVLAYIKTFSTFFADTTQRPEPINFGSAPGGGTGADALKVGRQFYDSIGCRKCHGDQGRGDGPSAPTLKDDAGHPIFAADLHENWRFNGGGTVEDIYHRLRTGLDGTPMPSFSDLLEQKFLSDEQLWRLAQYVRSLSTQDPPVVQDVIHAPLIKTLPHSPDDSAAWKAVAEYWFPLVGQVIKKERWFAPAVSAVRVQAVHTADSIALRVVWDDRSQSPDSAWLAHIGRVFNALDPDSAREQPALWPDQLTVQFPVSIRAGLPVAMVEHGAHRGGRRLGARRGTVRSDHRSGRHGAGPGGLRPRAMACRVHARTCFARYRNTASVPERPCHSRGVLRLGRVER
jgi:mono/diheme cytochrome c family protein